MRSAMKKSLLQMLGELVLVTVGVYVGLVASNWNEERRRAANAREFLGKVAREIKANQAKVRQSLSYRKAVLTASSTLLRSLNPQMRSANFWKSGGFTIIPGWRGAQILSLENSVYQSGIISSVLADLDFETTHTIAQVYNHQEEYKLLVRMLITDKLTAIDEAATTSKVIGELQWWADVTKVEGDLVRKYDEALAELKGRHQ